jgi:transcriptional regulator with XRE-family HTH domain
VFVPRDEAVLRDFVPLIRWAMSRKGIPQRKLASLTGISKSRLGLVVHSDPDKRSPMTVDELQIILHALGTDLVEAYIRTKVRATVEQQLLERHDSLISMLCDAFVDMPEILIVLLEELDGLDGSEVRRDWAKPMRRAIVAKLVDEVRAKLARRARLVESDDFRI